MKRFLLPLVLLIYNFSVAQTALQTYVPDDNFEQYLIDQGYDDVLDDYVLSETLQNITQLDLSGHRGYGVEDLTGIEDFANLEYLDLDYNGVSRLDVSKNLKLEFLNVTGNISDDPGNDLEGLDLSKNSELKELIVGGYYQEGFTTLDLSKNHLLEKLKIIDNFSLSKIIYATQNSIKELSISGYVITDTELDLGNLPLLENLELYNFRTLKTIDLSANTNLKDIHFKYVGDNAKINLKNNNNTIIEQFKINQSSEIACIQVDNLEFAQTSANWEVSIGLFAENCSLIDAQRTFVPDDYFEQALIDQGYDDVLDDYVLTSNIDEMDHFEINRNNVQDLTGINDFIALETLDMENNQLMSIDISHLSALRVLNLGNNSITKIDLSNNPYLTYLNVRSNQLNEIDVSTNTLLTSFYIGQNMLHSLDVSNIDALQAFGCPSNRLETLDLSKNYNLTHVDCTDNQLTFLNLKNGNNTNLNVFAQDNTENLCIQVDDITIPSEQNDWYINETTRYSEDCSVTNEDSDNDGVLDTLDICPNTPKGQNVNNQGCSLTQYADIAVQNVSIGLGSFLCSEPQNCTVDVAVQRDVDIQVSVVKNENETIFEGIVGISNPLFLENLTEGEYSVCATRSDIPSFMQCYQVSSTATQNSVSTTIVMQNPGQVYTLTVEGNKKYEVLVNDLSTIYEFDSVEKQNLEIPLEVGTNAIQVIGEVECEDIELVINEEGESDKSSDNLLIFPTLSDGLITLENTKQHQIHGITVTSLNGVTDEYMPINGNPKEIEIDMRGAAKGMYIVRIQQASGKVGLIKIMLQ